MDNLEHMYNIEFYSHKIYQITTVSQRPKRFMSIIPFAADYPKSAEHPHMNHPVPQSTQIRYRRESNEMKFGKRQISINPKQPHHAHSRRNARDNAMQSSSPVTSWLAKSSSICTYETYEMLRNEKYEAQASALS